MYGAQLMAPKSVSCRSSVPSRFIVQTSAIRPVFVEAPPDDPLAVR